MSQRQNEITELTYRGHTLRKQGGHWHLYRPGHTDSLCESADVDHLRRIVDHLVDK